VNQPGPVAVGVDVVGGVDLERAFVVRMIGHLLAERMLVGPAEQVLAGDFLLYLVVVVAALPQDLLVFRLGEVEQFLLAVSLRTNPDIIAVLVDRDKGVRRDRPRSRRPDDERALSILEVEFNVNRGILDVLVLDLVVRDGGLTARTLRDGAVALLD